MSTQVTVGMLTLARPKTLGACLRSLRASVQGPLGLHILSQGPVAENLAELDPRLLEEFDTQITVLDRNAGCSAGRRILSEQIVTPYMFFSDDDMFFTPGWLDPLVSAMVSRPEVGAVSPTLVQPNGSLELGGRLDRQGSRLTKRWYSPREAVSLAADSGLVPSDFLLGGCVLIRREVFDSIGHDPNYPNGWEDLDFWLQMMGTDWVRHVHTGARIYHKHPDVFDVAEAARGYRADRGNVRTLRSSRAYFESKWAISGVRFQYYLPERFAVVYRLGRAVKRRFTGVRGGS